MDDRRRDMVEVIEELDLLIGNRPGTLNPFAGTLILWQLRPALLREPNIDLTLLGNWGDWHFLEWGVKSWSNSDHRAMKFNINQGSGGNNNLVGEEVRGRYCFSKANWKKLEMEVRSRLDREWMELNTADDKANKLELVITEAMEAHIPNVGEGRRDLAWWTPKLDKLRRTVRTANKEMMRDLNEGTIGVYRTKRNRYVAEIRTTKSESWREFVTQRAKRDIFGLAGRVARGKLCRRTDLGGMFNETDGRNHRGVVEALLRRFYPADCRDNDTAGPKLQRLEVLAAPNDQHYECRKVTAEELHEAIRGMGKKRAPDHDGVTVGMILQIWETVKDEVLSTFNMARATARAPQTWKKGIVKIIPKATPGEYRPRTLLPVLGKLFEKMLLEDVIAELWERSLVHGRQYGFVKGRATNDMLLDIREVVLETAAKYVLGIFLDIKGAFDRAWWPEILKGLQDGGLTEWKLALIRDYFINRRVIYNDLGVVIEKDVELRVPQGSVMGPTLWNMVMPGFLNLELRDGCDAFAYDDYGAVLIQGNSRDMLELRADRALDIIAEWGRKVKVKFSETKTRGLMMKGKFLRRPRVFMSQNRIRIVDRIKFLGIWFEDGDRCNRHIEEAAREAF